MRFITYKPRLQVSNDKLKLAETDPPPTPFSDVANQSSMTCGECGNHFLPITAVNRCVSCSMDFCGYDCAIKHQEKTGHYLTHMIN